jgi:hypothetical protein
MKRFREIKRGFAEFDLDPVAPERDFWHDFGVQARGVRRDEAAGWRVGAPVLRVALAAAAAVVLLAAFHGFVGTKSAPVSGSRDVRSLTVEAPYGAVFILQDAEHNGTILWVVES